MVYPKAQQDGLQLTPGLISNDPEIGTAMTQINVHIYVSSAPSYLVYIKLVKVRCLLMENYSFSVLVAGKAYPLT